MVNYIIMSLPAARPLGIPHHFQDKFNYGNIKPFSPFASYYYNSPASSLVIPPFTSRVKPNVTCMSHNVCACVLTVFLHILFPFAMLFSTFY